MQANDIINYFLAIEKDDRLNVWHIAILAAIMAIAIEQGRLCGIRVSRSKIMTKSHIHTLPTYHKYFKELQDLGYITYRPSYHPGVRSEIDIRRQPF